jgi:3-phenylpropionate/trans-cinnamate dioxygenase ferredoxin reductase component
MADTTVRRIVVVGHGIAGLTAGDTLRREGFDGDLVVVGAEPHRPYSRPALSKAMMSAPAEDGAWAGAQYLASPSDGAEVLTGRAAVGLDVPGRRVLLDDGTALAYDGLVIATGARPRRLGAHPQELTLRSLADAEALRRQLAEGQPDVTVVGGGPLGLEVASGARAAGCAVTLIHRGLPLAGQLGPELAGVCAAAAEEHGVRRLDDRVAALDAAGDRPGSEGLVLTLASGRRHTASLVVSAIGDVPEVGWLADSGLLADGRLTVDEWGFCSPDHPEIVAAGDAVWRRTAAGTTRRALWTDAIEQAKGAARALLQGRSAPPAEYLPYFWTEQFGLTLRVSGEVPADVAPVVVDGDLAGRRALLRWDGPDGVGASAALNYRIPIPKLRRLALSETAAA